MDSAQGLGVDAGGVGALRIEGRNEDGALTLSGLELGQKENVPALRRCARMHRNESFGESPS